MNIIFRLLNDLLNDWWLMFGFFAQFLFFLRFIIQWLCSEKAKKVVIPLAFWYLGIIGGILLFIYATHRQDPVFMVGLFLLVLIYSRNLVIAHRERKNKNKTPHEKNIIT